MQSQNGHKKKNVKQMFGVLAMKFGQSIMLKKNAISFFNYWYQFAIAESWWSKELEIIE